MVEKEAPTNPVNIEIHKAAERMLIECPFLFEIICERNISKVFLSIAPGVMERIALVMKTCPWEILDHMLLAKIKHMLESAPTPDNLEYLEVICGPENNDEENVDEQKINVEVHMKHAVTREVGWFAVTTHFVGGQGVENSVG